LVASPTIAVRADTPTLPLLAAELQLANAFTGRCNVPKSLQGWQMNDNGPEIRTDRHWQQFKTI
jgi:hypothetical protein